MKKSLKKIGNANPVMTQRFGADPYAMVYEDRVYLYMTGDDFIYDETGEIKENNYSNIYTINVISSSDLVNWTDHGSVYAASEKGAASWGTNSWAPAAACREIDGKMKFFRILQMVETELQCSVQTVRQVRSQIQSRSR